MGFMKLVRALHTFAFPGRTEALACDSNALKVDDAHDPFSKSTMYVDSSFYGGGKKSPPRVAGQPQIVRDAHGYAVPKHVLLAESHALVSRCLSESLEIAGWRVSLTNTGEHAMTVIEKGGLGVVVCNIHLSRTNSLEFLQRVQAVHPELPVIFFGFEKHASQVEVLLQAGAAEFVFMNDDFDTKLPQVVEGVFAGRSKPI